MVPRSREAQRADKRRRYYDYLDLCEQLDVAPQYGRWSTHRRELTNAPHQHHRPTAEELRQWWRDRFTLKEIRAMGGSLEFLLSEEERAA